MEHIKDILNPNWIGVIIGLIGIIVGVILAFSFRPRPRLATQVTTLQLVQGPDSVLRNQIEFLFRGEKVPKVTMSRVAIWNCGNRLIRGDQIVSSDPLRIVTSEGSNILEVTVFTRTREVNDISCVLRQDKSNEAECRFDYLDSGDAVIQLIHTGDDKVMVTGTLRGIPKQIMVVGVSKNEKGEQVPATSTTAAKLFP